MPSQGGDSSSSNANDPRRRSKKTPGDDSHEVETVSEFHAKGDAAGNKHEVNATSTNAPPSSAVQDAQSWKRKRSSFLLQSMHPEGARESATFVDKLPQPTALRMILVLFAYALLLSDVPRGGSSIETLPYVQLEPNVFAVFGPTTLAGRTIFRNGSTVNDGTSGTTSDVSTALYKYAPSSYGLRTARDLLDFSNVDATWPTCLLSSRYPASWYSIDCGDTLPGTTVFTMLDSLVDAVAANAVSTTSYKNVAQTDDGIAIMARGELSSFPQRVSFAARAKARWTGTSSAGSGVSAESSSTSFLSRNLLDHKYWLSVWATVFNDLNPANPGVDLCVDDLDRPLFCEKPWAAAQNPDGTPSENPPLWEAVSSRVAELQAGLAKGEKLDITLVETESDPLTRLGGAVLLAHKIYNAVVLYRIQECTEAGDCTTLAVLDERVEGKILYTDALEWSSLAATLRYIGQVYITIRLACLLIACFAAVDQTTEQKTNADTPRTVQLSQILNRAVRIFFAVPTQVVVYGSWITVLCYASAHIVDALIHYELEDNGADSATETISSMTRWLAVHMRSIWLMALLARIRALLQTSAGAWTPGHGVSGVRGHLLPTLALGAVVFVVRGGISVDDRDARILEANEVEPVPTFMLLRAETLDAWKMNLEGAYSDMLSIALAAVIYAIVILSMRALFRWYRRRAIKPTNASQRKARDRSDAVPEPLFFARSAVPSAAGALWEPSCLSVSWDDDLIRPLIDMLESPNSLMGQLSRHETQGSSKEGDADASFYRGGDGTVTSSASSTQRMLMNLVFLSDPWNLLVLKLGRARVHLYHLHSEQLDCKVVHAQTKARVAREYALGPEHVELVASLRASELSWGQLITCK